MLSAHPFSRARPLLRPAWYGVFFRVGVDGPVGTLESDPNKTKSSDKRFSPRPLCFRFVSLSVCTFY